MGSLKKINELKTGDREVNLTASIDSISEPRTVNLRAGGTAQVADAIISDETGNIKLSLWDDQIKSVKQGDMISIENGYTQSFRGENSLSIGRYGRLKKL
jgi:replication factor A1